MRDRIQLILQPPWVKGLPQASLSLSLSLPLPRGRGDGAAVAQISAATPIEEDEKGRVYLSVYSPGGKGPSAGVAAVARHGSCYIAR